MSMIVYNPSSRAESSNLNGLDHCTDNFMFCLDLWPWQRRLQIAFFCGSFVTNTQSSSLAGPSLVPKSPLLDGNIYMAQDREDPPRVNLAYMLFFAHSFQMIAWSWRLT